MHAHSFFCFEYLSLSHSSRKTRSPHSRRERFNLVSVSRAVACCPSIREKRFNCNHITELPLLLFEYTRLTRFGFARVECQDSPRAAQLFANLPNSPTLAPFSPFLDYYYTESESDMYWMNEYDARCLPNLTLIQKKRALKSLIYVSCIM